VHLRAVIKNPFNSLLHGKMRLMQLLPTIIKLEKQANEKAEIAQVLDLRKYALSGQATPPFLTDAQTRVKVSEHGLIIMRVRLLRVLSYVVGSPAPPPPAACVRGCAPGTCARESTAFPRAEPDADAQASDAYCFECVPVPSPPSFYYVRYAGGSSSAAGSTAADELPIDSSELAALDYGAETSLEDRFTAHIVSIDSCTCNTLAHDGLGCVHMMRIWVHFGLTRVPNGVVHRRWAARIGDEEDLHARARRAARFRSDQQQTARELLDASQRSGGVKKTLSQQEQYLALMTKGKVLFSAAARDPAMAAAVHNTLNAALTQLADGDLGKPPSHGRKQAAAARRANETAERERAAAESAAPAADGAGAASAPAPEPEAIVVPNARSSISTKRRVTQGTGQRASGNKQAKPKAKRSRAE
jgi:hypothetical protein